VVAPSPVEFERRIRARTQLRNDDIGGGKVIQGFRMGGEYVRPGTILSREQILGIPYANRASLMARFIEVWPREAGKPEGTARFIVRVGTKYNVIEGVVLNAEPLEKEEAEELKNSG
jgi:hypothetical protein